MRNLGRNAVVAIGSVAVAITGAVTIATSAASSGGAPVASHAFRAVNVASETPASSKHCPYKHRKYPPSNCKIYFDHKKFHHGDKAHFNSGAVFKPGETVTVDLNCRPHHIHVNEPNTHAHSAGRVYDHIHVPDGAQHCTVTLHGQASNVTVSNGFDVN
jgi:hypothetical protein